MNVKTLKAAKHAAAIADWDADFANDMARVYMREAMEAVQRGRAARRSLPAGYKSYKFYGLGV